MYRVCMETVLLHKQYLHLKSFEIKGRYYKYKLLNVYVHGIITEHVYLFQTPVPSCSTGSAVFEYAPIWVVWKTGRHITDWRTSSGRRLNVSWPSRSCSQRHVTL